MTDRADRATEIDGPRADDGPAEHTLAVLFRDRDAAAAAMEALIGAGIPGERFRVISEADETPEGDTRPDEGGIHQALHELVLVPEDVEALLAGIRDGGAALVFRATPAEESRAQPIIEAHDPVGLGAGKEDWRTAGWAR